MNNPKPVIILLYMLIKRQNQGDVEQMYILPPK